MQLTKKRTVRLHFCWLAYLNLSQKRTKIRLCFRELRERGKKIERVSERETGRKRERESEREGERKKERERYIM